MDAKKWTRLARYGGILLCVIIIITLVLGVQEGFDKRTKHTSSPLAIDGEFCVDDGKVYPMEEYEGMIIRKASKVVIEGSFSGDVSERYMIFFRLENVKLDFYVNDKLIVTTREEDSEVFEQCYGRSCIFVPSPGISKTDHIRIELVSPLKIVNTGVIDKFLEDLSYGEGEFAFLNMLERKCVLIGLCLVTIGIGFYTLIFFSLNKRNKVADLNINIAISAMVIACGLWSYFSVMRPFSGFLSQSKMFAYQLAYMNLFLLPIVLALSLYFIVETKLIRKIALTTVFVSIILALVAFLLELLGIVELVQTRVVSLVGDVMVVVTYFVMWWEILRYREYKKMQFCIATIPLLLGGVLQLSNFYFQFFEFSEFFTIGYAASALLLVFVLIQNMQRVGLQMREASELRNEVTQKRIDLMVSQIQPHFLFNALNAIKQLCAENPAQAEEAVGHFARYMRLNLDTLRVGKPVPFDVELECVKNYLYIEQIRVGDRLRIVYEIEDSEFYLPALTVQPLAENAVRHGITKKKDGGTLTIHTERTANEHVIIVSDDGVGYNVDNVKKDGVSHVGIGNVKERLHAMVMGSLKIESEKGKGTIATIRIPIVSEKGIENGQKDVFGG